MPQSPRAILIAGPTASGKSALAIALAERYGGTIVNADSMQIYADLRVLTARPSAAQCGRISSVVLVASPSRAVLPPSVVPSWHRSGGIESA